MSVHNLVPIHPVVVEIFPSGPKWWTDIIPREWSFPGFVHSGTEQIHSYP